MGGQKRPGGFAGVPLVREMSSRAVDERICDRKDRVNYLITHLPRLGRRTDAIDVLGTGGCAQIQHEQQVQDEDEHYRSPRVPLVLAPHGDEATPLAVEHHGFASGFVLPSLGRLRWCAVKHFLEG